MRSQDTDATLKGLLALGARFEVTDGSVRFEPAPLRAPTQPIQCGGSGTTLRLLAAQAARCPAPVALDGDASLRRRASPGLVAALGACGVDVRPADGRPPLVVRGPLRSGAVRLQGDDTSQTVSALLLALPLVAGASELHVAGPVLSRPYIDLTLAMAERAGLRYDVTETGTGLSIRSPGGQRPDMGSLRVEGDWSAAAFFFLAAALTGGEVSVTGLRPDSAQGDREILGHVETAGCMVKRTAAAVTVRGPDQLLPLGTVDVGKTPDLFPALAVLAAAADGETWLTGAPHLRGKESDRIRAMAVGLRAFGVQCDEEPDGLRIQGGRLRSPAGPVPVQGDHRIHMALAVAALAAPEGASIADPACVAKSYPAFHADLGRIGAQVGMQEALA